MFTNNYIAFQKKRFVAGTNYNDYCSFINATGESVKGYACYFLFADIGYWMRKAWCKALVALVESTNICNTNYSGLYFGSGSTPASKKDYKLENMITSGLTITNPSSLAWSEDGKGKYEAFADFIVRNITKNEITISEIGVFSPIGSTANTTFSNNVNVHQILMERTVLDEPITIAPGESKLVTYKLTFNQTIGLD